ncbi:MAG: pitrilysin family protein [Acidobacteriota bacterium]|nr:insulinase family protein [Blastocatellia bacterium]MDW8411982.1 pitrilysin family protein [Acidobacteriota bacterium]
MQKINKTKLPNGLVVLSEVLPQARSVSLGLWLRKGSRHEPAELNGISHFIEHNLFKGTRKRSARQIALEADLLGGNLDAFTTQEMTAYQIKVLDKHFEAAFDILADMFTSPTFEENELEKERSVILEEIKTLEDSPEDYIFELLHENLWPAHPIGFPITGTISTVKKFNRTKTVDYYNLTYTADNLVVAAAGRLSHDHLLELSERYFSDLPSSKIPPKTQPLPKSHVFHCIKKKMGLEQTHAVLAAEAVAATSSDRYACELLSTILGGGLSSRLFQTVRETHGLAYSIYSSIDTYTDTGYISIYMAVANNQLEKALQLVLDEICSMKRNLVAAEELHAAKEQLKSSIMLGQESVTARMHALAENELLFGRHIYEEELLQAIDSVSAEEVQQLAQKIFRPQSICSLVLSPKPRGQLDYSYFNC